MKTQLMTLALVATLGAAFAAAPLTTRADATNTPAASTPAKAKNPRFHGVLSAVDTTANTITVTYKTEPAKTISVTSDTKIKKDDKEAKLGDLAVGDHVGGSYTTDASGKLTAVTLNGHSPKAAKN